MSELTIRWQSFRVAVHGKERTAARLIWSGKLPVVRDAGPLLVRVLPFSGARVAGAFVVASGEGALCPELADGRYLVPPPATEQPFYLLIDALEEGGRFGFDVHVSPTWDEAQQVLHSVVDLADAWPNPPDDLATEITTLRRLAATGGHRAERRGYRRLAMEILARSTHPEIEALRIDLRKPETIDAMDVDLRPVCFASEILAIAVLADAGQVAEVGRRLKDLPRSVRTDQDVAVLADIAREADPLPQQQQLLETVRAARASGHLDDALELLRRIGTGSPVYAEAHGLHLETAADLIEGALQNGDIERARRLIREEGRMFEGEVGPSDPWWSSIRQAAGLERVAGPQDVEYAEELDAVELGDDDLEPAGQGLWGKMRTWLKFM